MTCPFHQFIPIEIPTYLGIIITNWKPTGSKTESSEFEEVGSRLKNQSEVTDLQTENKWLGLLDDCRTFTLESADPNLKEFIAA